MTYSTYKYYDKDGRRLSVFCRYIEPTKAEITTIACSKHDAFKKVFARSEYYKYISGKPYITHPTKEIIDMEKEKSQIYTLLKYCETNYYKYFPTFTFKEELLKANIYTNKYK